MTGRVERARGAISGAAIEAGIPSAASVLALVQAIERHGPDAPAAIAFRSALRRKGVEAGAAVGIQALDALMDEIAEADPERVDACTVLLRAAWANVLPAPAGRTHA